jgi:diguanylate cyclase (GGDEF)-like protein
MPSSPSPSPDPLADGEPRIIRRFVEASRRAEIVALVNGASSAEEVCRLAAGELSEAFDAELAFVAVAERGGRLEVVARVGLSAASAAAAVADPLTAAALAAGRARAQEGEDVLGLGARAALVCGVRPRDELQALVGVARLYDEPFDPGEVALLEAVADSVGHALERWWLSDERDRHAAHQTALARMAALVNASLVRDDVVAAVAGEAARALRADVVLVALCDGGGPLEVVGGRGLAPAARCVPGGLCERVLRSGLPAVVQPPHGIPDVEGVRSGIAVPLRRGGEIDGVLLVGHHDGRWSDADDVELLVAFGELTSGALRNADAHAAAQRAATLDPLTGVLNHGAFMARAREEIARAERAGATGGLSLILLDLDEFKAVNDRFGHLRGDALLRRVAAALRGVARPYDRVGRYGGDEFAILLPAADALTARRVLDRTLSALRTVPLPGGGAVSARGGVAEWGPGDGPSDLVERADLELIASKRARRPPAPHGSRGAARRSGEEAPGEAHLRRLAAVSALGTRLAWLLDPQAIADIAVRELAAALGHERCLLVRGAGAGEPRVVAGGAPGEEPGEGPALRRALAEARTVLDPDARDEGLGSELAVPVDVGGDLWGALVVRSPEPAAFTAADVQLVEGVAEHVGAALRTAELVRRLDETALGTAEALAAALEAGGASRPRPAGASAELAVQVGRALGLGEEALRDLRYGAILHDIGMVAVPRTVLTRAGALDPDALAAVRRHPVVGEQILAPVPFLAGVQEIVRQHHERWDGGGYPEGLREEEIAPGARVVLVVDAWQAMTSDRPYRGALGQAEARAELLAHAGTQFDPAAVTALLRALGPGRA